MRWPAAVTCYVLLVGCAQADTYNAFQAMQSYASLAMEYMRSDGTPETYSAPELKINFTASAVTSSSSIKAPLRSHMPGNLSSFATVQSQSDQSRTSQPGALAFF